MAKGPLRKNIPSETLAEVFRQLAEGKTLIEICAKKGMPSKATIYRMVEESPQLRDDYTRARSKQADTFAEMIVTESRTATDAQLGRLRMDALKWAASKIAPKKYGDKVEVEHAGEVDIVVKIGGTLGPRNG
jgi:hypothetical protein